jgi:hypothetical protein
MLSRRHHQPSDCRRERQPQQAQRAVGELEHLGGVRRPPLWRCRAPAQEGQSVVAHAAEGREQVRRREGLARARGALSASARRGAWRRPHERNSARQVGPAGAVGGVGEQRSGRARHNTSTVHEGPRVPPTITRRTRFSHLAGVGVAAGRVRVFLAPRAPPGARRPTQARAGSVPGKPPYYTRAAAPATEPRLRLDALTQDAHLRSDAKEVLVHDAVAADLAHTGGLDVHHREAHVVDRHAVPGRLGQLRPAAVEIEREEELGAEQRRGQPLGHGEFARSRSRTSRTMPRAGRGPFRR